MDNTILTFVKLDWLAVALSFAAIRELGKRQRHGFTLFMMANTCWIAFGYLSGNAALLAGNLAFLVNNFVAYRHWEPAPAGSSPMLPGAAEARLPLVPAISKQ